MIAHALSAPHLPITLGVLLTASATASTSHRKITSLAPWAFVLTWSSGAIFAELGLRYTSPVPFLAMRALLAAAIAWTVRSKVRDPLPHSRQDWTRTIATGLIMQGCYQVLFFLSLRWGASAGTLAAVLGLQPILTGALTAGRTAPWAGLITGLGGLVLVLAGSVRPSDVVSSSAGVLAACGALVSMTLGTIGQKRLANVGLWSSVAVQQGATAIGLCLAWAVAGGTFPATSLSLWCALSWMVLVVSTGATALLFFMAREGDPTQVSSMFYLVPPVTALLDFLVYGTRLTLIECAGIALVALALLVVSRTPRGHG